MKLLIASGVRLVREAGTAGLVLYQAEELRKLGHEVACWFYGDVIEKPSWPARFADLEFAYKVSRRIQANPTQYDVVNLLAPWGGVYGLSRKLFGSANLPPYVFTMQGSEERYALIMRQEHRKERATNFAWKNRVWHRLYHQTLYDFSIRTADFGAVACREGWTHSELKYKFRPGLIWFVPNGVSTEFFQPRTFRDGIASRLLFVGTWLDRKGIYYLVDAFAELAVRIPGVTLTVAGCALEQEQIRTYFPVDVRSRVSVMPFVARESMPGLYASHDILVLPSLIEGMPLTLLEAMATAMPVVTTNTCGMADMVEDGFNGLLVPAANALELALAIQRVCDSSTLREQLGTAAQETARRHTWDAIARQMENIFKMAVQRSKADITRQGTSGVDRDVYYGR
jgi:glycosyltransferase involved in cell wall biosynthesis